VVLLRERGLIITVHGRGTYVAPRLPCAADQPKIWSMTSAPLTRTGRSSFR
jgi:DNA-binding GntR family transcriptional regulator